MYELDNVDRIVQNILLKLIQNQNMMKCLKYNTSDALLKPDLDFEQIGVMINSDIQDDNSRIFFTPFNLDTAEDDRVELRFFISQFVPDNLYLTNLKIHFQLIVANKLWRLEEGRIRPLVMVQELLKTLHGQEVGFIGELQFNNPTNLKYYNSKYTGYELTPNTRSA